MFLRKCIAAAIILLLVAAVVFVCVISMTSESRTAEALFDPSDAKVRSM
jgi:tryptophan-rich sensory protein